MGWKFDQAPNVACITCQSVIDGHPILFVTHYEDDHSWCFFDGAATDIATALVVAMSEVVEKHPRIDEIADLPSGWMAERRALDQPWIRRRNV